MTCLRARSVDERFTDERKVKKKGEKKRYIPLPVNERNHALIHPRRSSILHRSTGTFLKIYPFTSRALLSASNIFQPLSILHILLLSLFPFFIFYFFLVLTISPLLNIQNRENYSKEFFAVQYYTFLSFFIDNCSDELYTPRFLTRTKIDISTPRRLHDFASNRLLPLSRKHAAHPPWDSRPSDAPCTRQRTRGWYVGTRGSW